MKTFTLANASCQVTLLDLGARLIDWQVDVAGKSRHIVLAYPNIEDYLDDNFYLGAVCGPYANRLAKGQVKTTNSLFSVTRNDGENHLHGGSSGFDKQIWRVTEKKADSILFEYQHADGQDGYPGPICISVEYRLTANSLTMDMRCSVDKPTIVGPTGHAYFNLNGTNSDLIGLDHYLQCNARKVTPLASDGIPDGEERSLEQGAFDFTQLKRLSSDPTLKELDNNFVFDGAPPCSTLTDIEQQLSLEVRSNYPAVQLYTGSFLSGQFKPNQGVCIEPHYGANAPNRQNDYDWLAEPGTTWHKFIEYKLTVN